MNPTTKKSKYVAFLRGINVGGHHKVPMADLHTELEKLGLENIETLLNSGNILFDANSEDILMLGKTISQHLEKVFGFPIPTILRTAGSISRLAEQDPFRNVPLTKDIRLYVTFLPTDVETGLQYPWTSDDNSFRIIGKSDKTILSVLDLSIAKTSKTMDVLERNFGKDITTRNWNTVLKLEKKIVSQL